MRHSRSFRTAAAMLLMTACAAMAMRFQLRWTEAALTRSAALPAAASLAPAPPDPVPLADSLAAGPEGSGQGAGSPPAGGRQ